MPAPIINSPERLKGQERVVQPWRFTVEKKPERQTDNTPIIVTISARNSRVY